MPEYILYKHQRNTEWTKASHAPSKLLPNALELIDGALWLVAGGRHSHAVAALHNAVELLFKAELERIHPILVADNRQLDYKSLKSLLKDAFQSHPHGKTLIIEDYDAEKTITFTEAHARIRDIYPSIKKWDQKLKILQSTRNDITHYGSNENKIDDYTFIITAIALPFLEEFLEISNDIDLKSFIGRNVSRELEIAHKVCQEIHKSGRGNFRVALKTVQRAILYRDVEFPAPFDREGWMLDESDRHFETLASLKRELRSVWTGDIVDTECQICGNVYAVAEIEKFDEDNPQEAIVLSFACAVCGLDLSRKDSPLPELHCKKNIST
ncbi:hypothetical protein [Burkholderia ubonensis]|uniref:hypothetical protein n=1 Tax=Burkholderia ubonensis TaxID=101571 RepID=UPI000B2891EB|nr:hypothetical protein [Burkholderia ubonensis]